MVSEFCSTCNTAKAATVVAPEHVTINKRTWENLVKSAIMFWTALKDEDTAPSIALEAESSVDEVIVKGCDADGSSACPSVHMGACTNEVSVSQTQDSDPRNCKVCTCCIRLDDGEGKTQSGMFKSGEVRITVSLLLSTF